MSSSSSEDTGPSPLDGSASSRSPRRSGGPKSTARRGGSWPGSAAPLSRSSRGRSSRSRNDQPRSGQEDYRPVARATGAFLSSDAVDEILPRTSAPHDRLLLSALVLSGCTGPVGTPVTTVADTTDNQFLGQTPQPNGSFLNVAPPTPLPRPTWAPVGRPLPPSYGNATPIYIVSAP